jgi:hypothetical protein
MNRERHPKEYSAVLDTLKENLFLYPNLNEFAQGTANQSKVELVYFTDVPRVLGILQGRINELRKDQDFNFSYERNKSMLLSFLMFVTNDELELRPLLAPEELLKMGKIQQIIFMSATLPDEELLHKVFGIGKSQIHMVDEQSISASAFEEVETLGKRLIFPLDQTDLGVKISQKCLDIILNLAKKHQKLVVLANSYYDTDAINKFLTYNQISVLICRNPGDSEAFAREMKTGVLLCANRYLGLDFPGDTCKVEVVVRLPAIWDSVDAFQLTVLNNSFYAEQRIGSRLTQSFGRCNRLATDEALYFILDSRILARFTGNEEYLRYLPRNMYAELMTGYYLSQGGNIDVALEYAANSFFERDDASYRKFLTDEKVSWTPKQTKVFVSKYDMEIEAWQKALVGSYGNAGQLFDFVADNCEKNADAFPEQNLGMISAFDYYLSSMCYYNAYTCYKNSNDKKLCLAALKKAIEKGGSSSWFNHLRAVYNSLTDTETEKLSFDSLRIEIRQTKEGITERYDDFINSNSSKKKNWKDIFNQMIHDVCHGSHGQMLAALRQYFDLLGFETELGDNSKGEPDIIASIPSASWKYVLAIEAKTKEKGEEEKVGSVTQVMGDAGVVERKTDSKVLPVLVTQKEILSPKAVEVAKQKVRILSAPVLAVIMDQTLKSIEAWSDLTASGKPQFVDSILSHYEIKRLFMPSDSAVVTPEDVKHMGANK